MSSYYIFENRTHYDTMEFDSIQEGIECFVSEYPNDDYVLKEVNRDGFETELDINDYR